MQGRLCRNPFVKATLMEHLLAPLNSSHHYCCAGRKAVPLVTEPDWHPVPCGPLQEVCVSLVPASVPESRVGGSPSRWLAKSICNSWNLSEWTKRQGKYIIISFWVSWALKSLLFTFCISIKFVFIIPYGHQTSFPGFFDFFVSLKSISFSSPLIDRLSLFSIMDILDNNATHWAEFYFSADFQTAKTESSGQIL